MSLYVPTHGCPAAGFRQVFRHALVSTDERAVAALRHLPHFADEVADLCAPPYANWG